ncbi:unnamed protein product [Brassicogethes aeneus]|uniref:Uncharacterized protein n=1 Tax=Brassicogethes aeneus TaxID=1431903 RepID=A0A9P0B6T1_BRAAE|nr:unnamed protein product [Brassicogethes aeneus]
MSTHKMKSSKFTQVNSLNDNEYRDYQNIVTILPDDGNQNPHCHNVNNSSELLLKSNYETFKTPEVLQDMHQESNANSYHGQEIEMMCNCVSKEMLYQPKTRFVEQCNSDTATLNRSYASLPKLETTNLSQFSLDRKSAKYQRQKHAYVCEQNRIIREMEKTASLRKMQSPEIINIHRGPSNIYYSGYDPNNCAKDDYGFRRGHSFRGPGSRSNTLQSNRRAAGDGMDAEMDDPEIIFEMTDHMGDCQCACDHVVYAPNYTTCLQKPH